MKKNKGITLIALVITIIILLILAGVSIATLTGQNGLLTKADTAKTQTQKADAEEQVKLAVMGSYDENRRLDASVLKKELEKMPDVGNIQDTEGGFPILVTVKDKYTFEIDDKGNIVLKNENNGDVPNPPEEEIIVTASDIANSSDKGEFYGATVAGYNCTNSAGVNNWKIYYADENNIYLIADNYIPYEYVPKGKDGTALNLGGSNYKVYFTNLNSSIYKGSADITDERLKELNKDYFVTKKYSSTNLNMKATAYLLDTSIWNVFKGDDADYAIGGSTIELLFKSYNDKYATNYQAQANSSAGYVLSKDGGSTWEKWYSGMVNKADRLYISEESIEKATGMWIASPTATEPEYGLCVSNTGYVGSNAMTLSVHGLRPVVCLKSTIKLKKTTEMAYEIYREQS